MNAPLTKVELTGVPETALWNLYQRASAARAGHLDDPRAVEVLGRLDYPFERFDVPYGGLAARLHALRVRTVDAALRRVLAGAPDATVVALGEGFETQFWRVDDGRLRWLALDLPEVVAVRRVVLPDGSRNRTLAGSAADADWTAQVDRGRPVIITAQGLLPYFERDEVHRLLTAWARLLPGAWLLFDAVTAPLQAVSRRCTSSRSKYGSRPWAVMITGRSRPTWAVHSASSTEPVSVRLRGPSGSTSRRTATTSGRSRVSQCSRPSSTRQN